MRKNIVFLLALVFLLTSLVGCNNVIPPESSGNQSEQPNQTPVTPPSNDGFIQGPDSGENSSTTPPEGGEDQPDDPTTPPESGDQPATPPDSGDVITGEFVTMYQTYTFEDNNVAIIKLENQSSKNYTVTINAKYLDAAGNELKAETQTFEGFPAGWENYLIFIPKIQFAKFTYTVELDAFNGEVALSKDSKAYFTRLYESKIFIMDRFNATGDTTKYPSILAEYEMENLHDINLRICLVVFDNTNNICFIHTKGLATSEKKSTEQAIYLQTTEKTIEWPDEIKSGVTGIVAIVSASK